MFKSIRAIPALKGLDGAARGLGDYRGKIVVLNFWATWCIPCREEMPVLVALKKRYEERARLIGGLNVGFTEQLTALVIFDGVHVHPMMSYSRERHIFSFILVRGRSPGVSYSISF